MGQQGGTQARRHDIVVLTALLAVMMAPLSAPGAVAVTVPASSQMAEVEATALVGEPAAETPEDAALRTTGTMAAIVAVTVMLVLAWWYLVRRRGD